MKHVLVIGGGIAGMAAAYALGKQRDEQDRPLRVTLAEAGPTLGGKIRTQCRDGFVLEEGPDSFITQKPWGLQLCRDLGMEEELVPCNEEQQAVYLVRKERLVRMPTGFRLVAPTQWRPFLSSPLLSVRGKVRVAGDLVLPPRRDAGDESIAGFLRRRFGAEAMEALGGPMMAGIYVADPERLSLLATFPLFAELERKHGSVIRGLVRARNAAAGRPRPPAMFMSFREGMQTLVNRLAARLKAEVRLKTAVQGFRRRREGYEVSFDRGEPVRADALILALPPDGAAALLGPHDADAAAILRGIRMVSSAVLSLGYRAADLPAWRPLDGFGFVAPKREHRPILACTWSSTKFPGRAPKEAILVRAFLGGALQESLADLPDDQLIRMVREELAVLMGLRAEPLVRQITRWPRANPQYDVGHLDRMNLLDARLKDWPGLALAGGGYRGIGIPDCIHSGYRAAEHVCAGMVLK